MSAKQDRIDPNEIKTRDYLLLALIQGATKSGTHKDKKKEADKRRARDWKHDRNRDY